MKKAFMSLTLLMGISVLAHAASVPSTMKKQREEFGALIQDGIESQKQLRKELRQSVGQTAENSDRTSEEKESGRLVIGHLEAEEVVAPTTNYVRQKPLVLPVEDRTQKRVSQELQTLGE